MFRHLFDFLMGFVVRFFVGHSQNFGAPLIDLDGAFDRLSVIASDTFDRLQRILFTLAVVSFVGILAVGVLVVRIYQIASLVVISFGAFQIDGAILFGLILAAIAGVTGAIMMKRLKTGPSAEDQIRKAHEILKRQSVAAPQIPVTPPSPLEDALALAIRHFIETREASAAQGPTSRASTTSNSEADSQAPKTTDSNWNPSNLGQA